MIVNSYKYKILLHKAYFDWGYGTTSVIKWFAGILGIGYAIVNKSTVEIVIGGLVYAIFCYVLGRLAYKYEWKIAEQEVLNQYDQFCKDIRSKAKI